MREQRYRYSRTRNRSPPPFKTRYRNREIDYENAGFPSSSQARCRNREYGNESTETRSPFPTRPRNGGYADGNARTRSPSPSRSKLRVQETEDYRKTFPRQSELEERSRTELEERSRTIGSSMCKDKNVEVGDDAGLRRMSQLAREELVSRKFEWDSLLTRKPENLDPGLRLPGRFVEPKTVDGNVLTRKSDLAMEMGRSRFYREKQKHDLNNLKSSSSVRGMKPTFELNDGLSISSSRSRGREAMTAEFVGHDIEYSNVPTLKRNGLLVYHRNENSERASIVDSLVDIIDGYNSSVRDDMREGSFSELEDRYNHDVSRESLHELAEQDRTKFGSGKYEECHCGSSGPVEYESELKNLKCNVSKESLHDLKQEYFGPGKSHFSSGSPSVEQDGEFHTGSTSCHAENESESKISENIVNLQVGEQFCVRQTDRSIPADETLYENEEKKFPVLKSATEEPKNIQGKTARTGRVVDLRKITQSRSPDVLPNDIRIIPNEIFDNPRVLDIKKHLGPVQSIKKRAHGRILVCSNQRKHKSLRRNVDEICEVVDVKGDEPVDKIRSSKTRPLENSEHFEHLVNIAFLKFVKELNEDTTQQRKFKEKRSRLKCSVCGSNSKWFLDSLSLVQHAFTSRTVGLRAEHLGLHRAICLHMGWNVEASRSHGFWVRQILPFSEALALKEDLIIWPPVVFIHDTNVAGANQDTKFILSAEQLGDIIKGYGIDQVMSKISLGKGASQGIMVVQFHGTYSGLQDAERLHMFFSEKKHGRTELPTFNLSDEHSQKTEKIEDMIYGYLGLAEDIHKLNFDAKRRCLVKSKKEIWSIANAAL